MDIAMTAVTPWLDDDWHERALDDIDAALAAVGTSRTGEVQRINCWGRSCVHTAPTNAGELWIKHGYRLPPGEERVLPVLSSRWPGRVPSVVATWSGGVAMEALRGRELVVSDPVDTWIEAARAIAEIEAGETRHIDEWLALGVRDRRPHRWAHDVEALLESDVVRGLEREVLAGFERLLPDFIERYPAAFESPATLVHQDSGCCNIHVGDGGPVIFDWADVVVGHAVFSCDRLLDQVPEDYREDVIAAFLEPLGCGRDEFDALRRSNVLHEVLRYHDELEYLRPGDPARESLGGSVQSQLRVLVAHESSRGCA